MMIKSRGGVLGPYFHIQVQAKLGIPHNEFLDSSQLSLNMERKERRTISAGNLQEGDGGLHHLEDSATS